MTIKNLFSLIFCNQKNEHIDSHLTPVAIYSNKLKVISENPAQTSSEGVVSISHVP